MVATGANAEFGRTAGGVVNVITKSGTNQVKGSLFHFQRLEGLTSNTSDGKPLTDFHREQFGGTVGGPVVKNKAFFFGAVEGIREHLLRPNLSESFGTPCAVGSPTLAANEALINGSPDCQRLALLGFFRSRGQEEGLPVAQDVNNTASLAKIDWNLSAANNLSVSYNFDLLQESQPDLRRALLRQLGERHRGSVEDQHPESEPVQHGHRRTSSTSFTSRIPRENRPRSSTPSAIPARHRHRVRPVVPIRQPVLPGTDVDELVKRFQLKDNFSIVTGDAHHQDRRRMAAHQQLPGVSRLLRGTVPVRQRRRLPSLCVARGVRRLRPEHTRLLERFLRDRAGVVRGGVDSDRRTAALLPAEQQSGRHRPRRGRRVGHRQRRVRAVHSGQMAGRPRADARLRPSLGCPADA